jgi:hypothetical protein
LEKIQKWCRDLNRACSKLHANRRLGFQTELVPCKSGKQIGLAYSRISDQDYLEQIVVLVICFVSHSAAAPPCALLLLLPNQTIAARI